MLATMEIVDILQHADGLAETILHSDIGENYLLSLYKLQSDKEAQTKISKFTSLKDLFEDVQRFGKYHPDYKRINMETREAKRDMDMHPTIAEFKMAETELQSILDEISGLIGHAVSEQVKTPAGNPFFVSSGGCSSGSCGTGGSCGCSA
ncbi:YlbF family regulator [Peribacillus sp. NPDC097264]|uniref:YlbF family regulator n=1 Tax=unclassified Peribacillus TaxID=2675266 RepID=UPI0037FF84D1